MHDKKYNFVLCISKVVEEAMCKSKFECFLLIILDLHINSKNKNFMSKNEHCSLISKLFFNPYW